MHHGLKKPLRSDPVCGRVGEIIKHGLLMIRYRSTTTTIPSPVEDPLDSACLPQGVRHRLFFQHRDLAEGMAHKYIRMTPAHKVDPEDLRMAAYEGLLYALDHFDPAGVVGEGSPEDGFRRYAGRCIFGYLMTEMVAQDPLDRRLIDQVREFRREQERLVQELGRAPTGEELRQEMGCRDEKRFQLLEALADYQVNVESLAPEEGGHEEPEGVDEWNVTRAAAYAGGQDPLLSNPPYEGALLNLFREHLREAIGSLPTLEQQVIEVHYYQEETLTQMAQDIGLSRQTLSQYHQRALAHLEETLTERGLDQECLPEVWVGDDF